MLKHKKQPEFFKKKQKQVHFRNDKTIETFLAFPWAISPH